MFKSPKSTNNIILKKIIGKHYHSKSVSSKSKRQSVISVSSRSVKK